MLKFLNSNYAITTFKKSKTLEFKKDNRVIVCCIFDVLIINTGGFMGRTTSVTIGGSLDGFIERMIATGRYCSTSEVMRSALRLLEQQDLLRKALDEGEASGECSLSLKDIAAKRKARLHV
ncbi:type II toxin-antitoxin system ParD family antitoxin [Vibrio parahaemolyticus]|uniref:type II toxin-antitoxin system ParD family antitoxin n=1 Tax=Vibrio parahaemolyticus TaxID=670 RepID=UPI003F5B01DD